MHWLCLGKPDWDQHPEHIADAAKHKPIGIAPHGALGERLHRQKKYDVLTDLLKRIRDQGVLVGLSAHDPALIEVAEEKGWDVDYYMCCLYYLTRPEGGVPEDAGRGPAAGRDLPAVRPAADVQGDPGDAEAVPGVQGAGGGPAGRQPGRGAAVLRGGVRRTSSRPTR